LSLRFTPLVHGRRKILPTRGLQILVARVSNSQKKNRKKTSPITSDRSESANSQGINPFGFFELHSAALIRIAELNHRVFSGRVTTFIRLRTVGWPQSKVMKGWIARAITAIGLKSNIRAWWLFYTSNCEAVAFRLVLCERHTEVTRKSFSKEVALSAAVRA